MRHSLEFLLDHGCLVGLPIVLLLLEFLRSPLSNFPVRACPLLLDLSSHVSSMSVADSDPDDSALLPSSSVVAESVR